SPTTSSGDPPGRVSRCACASPAPIAPPSPRDADHHAAVRGRGHCSIVAPGLSPDIASTERARPMGRRLVALALTLAAALAFHTPSAHAEATTLRVAKQFGLGYLQFMVMQDKRLIETHAKAAGLGDVAVEWATFRSSDVMNDALISGSVDFVSLGVPGLITICRRRAARSACAAPPPSTPRRFSSTCGMLRSNR